MKDQIYQELDRETHNAKRIEIEDFKPGMTIMVLYWSKTLNRYASVPCMALYKVLDDFTLENVE